MGWSRCCLLESVAGGVVLVVPDQVSGRVVSCLSTRPLGLCFLTLRFRVRFSIPLLTPSLRVIFSTICTKSTPPCLCKPVVIVSAYHSSIGPRGLILKSSRGSKRDWRLCSTTCLKRRLL